MSRVNLLPREIKKSQQTRRRTLLIAVIGGVVAGLIILFWVFQGIRLGQVNDKIDAQNRNNAELQQEIDALQQFEDLQAQAQQQEQLLTAAYAGEVAYSGVLVDISKVIPSDMYLTSYSSAVDTATAAEPTDGATAFVGTMTFAGASLHFESLSTWLTRLEEVEGWANPWMSNISQDAETTGAYTFDTSVDLTQDAVTERGKAGEVVTGG